MKSINILTNDQLIKLIKLENKSLEENQKQNEEILSKISTYRMAIGENFKSDPATQKSYLSALFKKFPFITGTLKEDKNRHTEYWTASFKASYANPLLKKENFIFDEIRNNDELYDYYYVSVNITAKNIKFEYDQTLYSDDFLTKEEFIKIIENSFIKYIFLWKKLLKKELEIYKNNISNISKYEELYSSIKK